jgi:hypothetical protein
MFHVHSIHLDPLKTECSSFEIIPTDPSAEKVCDVFADFLVNRPAQFRDKLGFLTRGDMALDWSAVPGGAAFASLFEGPDPGTMSVMVSGVNAAADQMMLSMFCDTVLKPLLEDSPAPEDFPERPLLLQVILPGMPELGPTFQLLSTTLASIFFRTVLRIALSDPAGSESAG